MTTTKSRTKTTKKATKKPAGATARTTKKPAAKTSAKPELTAARVNSRIKSLLGKKGDPAADLLSKDWRAFLTSEFSMSKDRAANLKKISAKDVDMVQGGLRDAVKNGGVFRLTLGASGGELTVQPGGTGAPSRKFTFIFFTCTFDTIFKNWHCHLGRLQPT